MSKMPAKKTFEEWLEGVEPGLRPLAVELRRMFLEAGPDLRELIKWGNPCFERKVRVFYLASQGDRYVTLGLWQGALLPNPEGLIEGTGKRMRHVKIRGAEELGVPAVGRIIRQALEIDGAEGTSNR